LLNILQRGFYTALVLRVRKQCNVLLGG